LRGAIGVEFIHGRRSNLVWSLLDIETGKKITALFYRCRGINAMTPAGKTAPIADRRWDTLFFKMPGNACFIAN